jgi:hypothetical protein
MRLDEKALQARCPECGVVKAIVAATSDHPDREQRQGLGMPPYALWLLLSGFAAAGLAFPLLKFVERRIQPAVSHTGPSTPPAPPLWDVTRAPILRDLNGDGVEDIVGRFRRSDAPGSPMFVGAFDGKTLQPLWSSGPLGDWADALAGVQLAHTGNALVVTDARGGVELRDLASGVVAKQHALPGVARQACAATDGTVKFWIDTETGGVFIEPDVPQPTPAPRPSWCPPPSLDGPRAHAMSLAAVPSVQGFTPSQVLNEGTDAVALGLLGGTPRLVGFDPDRKLVRWQRALASAAVPLGADLVERVLFVPQQLAAGRTLLALDAATGQLRWQASIPGQGMGGAAWERVIASGDRVYVPALTGLTLLDAHTGARLGVLGR